MVDKQLTGRKLAEMDVYLEQLKEFSGISLAKYSGDWKIQRIVERTLQILIELCIDIGNHIISDSSMEMPTGYADTFRVMMENRIINKSLFKTLEKMAKFRNLIVHQYEKIDHSIVVSLLHENLKDFEKYKKSVLKYLSS